MKITKLLALFTVSLPLLLAQPCNSPTQLISATTAGACSAAATSTQINAMTFNLGQMSSNVGLVDFSLTMWIQPNAAVSGGPVDSVFRITTASADTTPTTTNGIRLAMYMPTDSGASPTYGFYYG